MLRKAHCHWLGIFQLYQIQPKLIESFSDLHAQISFIYRERNDICIGLISVA